MKDRSEEILNEFPSLKKVLSVLNENNIVYAIAGSGALYLLGNERKPGDVDIFIKNRDHDLADKLFEIESFTYESPLENVRNSNPFGEHEMQITSGLKIMVGENIFDFDINDEVINNRIQVGELWILPPEEVLLIKAVLQRGEDVGKHDIEDIKKFIEIYPNINWQYLKRRIAELDAAKRVNKVFEEFKDFSFNS